MCSALLISVGECSTYVTGYWPDETELESDVPMESCDKFVGIACTIRGDPVSRIASSL